MNKKSRISADTDNKVTPDTKSVHTDEHQVNNHWRVKEISYFNLTNANVYIFIRQVKQVNKFKSDDLVALNLYITLWEQAHAYFNNKLTDSWKNKLENSLDSFYNTLIKRFKLIKTDMLHLLIKAKF